MSCNFNLLAKRKSETINVDTDFLVAWLNTTPTRDLISEGIIQYTESPISIDIAKIDSILLYLKDTETDLDTRFKLHTDELNIFKDLLPKAENSSAYIKIKEDMQDMCEFLSSIQESINDNKYLINTFSHAKRLLEDNSSNFDFYYIAC